jgi:hypothetical protein
LDLLPELLCFDRSVFDRAVLVERNEHEAALRGRIGRFFR